MKKIIALVVALLCICTSAFASPLDMAKTPADELNFDIFRYINSGLTKTQEPETEQEEIDSSDTVVPEESKKPVTMRSMAAGMCVADSVSKAIVDGDDVVKVVYHTGTEGKLYECYFNYKSGTKGTKFTYEDITKGSIFYVGVTSEGFVSSYVVVASVNKTTKMFDVDEAAVRTNFNPKRVSCSFSYITDIIRRNGRTTVSLGTGEDLTFADDTAEFVYHNYGRSNEVHAGDFERFRVDTPEYDEENDISEVYMVFAMKYEDETVAICSITTPAYVKGNAEE